MTHPLILSLDANAFSVYKRGMDFKDRVVVITGASSGIGEALASSFARRGANIVMSSRSQERSAAARQRVGYTERTALFAYLTDHKYNSKSNQQ